MTLARCLLRVAKFSGQHAERINASKSVYTVYLVDVTPPQQKVGLSSKCCAQSIQGVLGRQNTLALLGIAKDVCR